MLTKQNVETAIFSNPKTKNYIDCIIADNFDDSYVTLETKGYKSLQEVRYANIYYCVSVSIELEDEPCDLLSSVGFTIDNIELLADYIYSKKYQS